jgi:hypothetical protein
MLIIAAHTAIQHNFIFGSARSIFIVVNLPAFLLVARANRHTNAIRNPAETFYMLGFPGLRVTLATRTLSTKPKIFRW